MPCRARGIGIVGRGEARRKCYDEKRRTVQISIAGSASRGIRSTGPAVEWLPHRHEFSYTRPTGTEGPGIGPMPDTDGLDITSCGDARQPLHEGMLLRDRPACGRKL